MSPSLAVREKLIVDEMAGKTHESTVSKNDDLS